MLTDYKTLSEEIIKILENASSIVLATYANGKVTARTMSHVNDGLTILFQTGNNSEKARQIKENSNVAFALNNLQIEAAAEIHGHPTENTLFIEKYKAKFPNYFSHYSNNPNEILIMAKPIKIAIYKYIDGIPCKEILDINENKAYRVDVD